MKQTVKRVAAVAVAAAFTTAAWTAVTAGAAQADTVAHDQGTRVTEDGLLDLDVLDHDHDWDDWHHDHDLIDLDIL